MHLKCMHCCGNTDEFGTSYLKMLLLSMSPHDWDVAGLTVYVLGNRVICKETMCCKKIWTL